MPTKYISFKKYPDAVQAKELQQYLISNGIECVFIDISSGLDNNFSGSLLKEYEIQVKPSDFAAAGRLLEKHAEEMLAGLDEDYYLLSFTDEELLDVVLKQDEWNEFDYVLARRLLSERGKAIDEEQVIHMRKQRLTDLARPETNHKGWIVTGYITSLLGGLFGIIIGYVIITSRKTLPNGQQVFTYAQSDRIHGKTILTLGLIVLPVYIMIKIIDNL